MLHILKIEHEVKNRLENLDLKMNQIADIAKRAISKKYNATLNHPLNAPGTFSYHEGVNAMREIVTDGVTWKRLVQNGIEYIDNPGKNIRIIYQNVDYACNSSHDPQPTSKRGGSAKRDAISSNQTDLFGRELTPTNVWVICVSENNGIINAEISMPTEILKNGSFSQFVERIFVLQNHRVDDLKDNQTDTEDNYDDDIIISLKD
ncbi:MAG: hypothetical protein ACU83U_00140 [Gammaproteobacteria bacterium]